VNSKLKLQFDSCILPKISPLHHRNVVELHLKCDMGKVASEHIGWGERRQKADE
jgi:hypothetical protein